MDEKMLSLSMVSHELKNPLTLIRSTLQVIESRHIELLKEPLWSRVYQDVDYMSRLLSELSVLDKEMPLKPSEVHVKQMMMDVEGMFLTEAMKQKKRFTIRCQNQELYVRGDELKLRQMLINLIQNALEATNIDDCIDVIVEQERNNVLFHVCDTGCGMDLEQQERLFHPFVTNKPNGTGLGMAIVKQIVDEHGGSIYVQSSKDCGTKITIELSIEK